MRIWVSCLALLVAGCTTAPVDAPQDDSRAPDPEPPQPDPPAPPPQEDDAALRNSTPPMHPPQLNVTLSSDNGTAPLQVTVTINGSDPDGDPLAWSVLVNGTPHSNGTTLPATVDLVLLAGEHNVTILLTDGNATIASSRTVAVHPVLQMLEDKISGKSAGCIGDVAYDATTMGYVEVAVDPATRGTPFFVHFAGDSALDVFLILDAEGEELEQAMVGVNEIGPDALEVPTWTHAGTVPDEAALLVFAACDNLHNSAPVDATPERFRYIAGPDAAPDPLR